MFFSDEPITSADADRLGRRIFVNRLVQGIMVWDRAEPLVMALTGEWGQGKTSVLNLVDAQLQQLTPRLIICKFNPWDFNSPERLIQGFLTAIESSLLRRLSVSAAGKTRRRFRQLRRSVSSVDVSADVSGSGPKLGGKLSIDPRRFENAARSSRDILADLAEIMKDADIRIAVFIDDLDRLGSSELLTTLKLIRLSVEFKRITYIMALDRNRAADTLAKQTDVPDGFLEKVINIEIPLPSIQRSHFNEIFNNLIDEVLNNSEVVEPADFGQRFAPTYHSSLSTLMPTIRDAKRYLNALAFTLPLVKNEVNIVDFMLIESIRIFSPRAYNMIYKHRNDLAGFTGYSDSTEHENRDRRALAFSAIMKAVLPDSANAVRSIIGQIFPLFEASFHGWNMFYRSEHVGVQWQQEQRACHPSYIDRFFVFDVLTGDVPDASVVRFVNEINNDSNSNLELIIRNSISQHDAMLRERFLNKVRVGLGTIHKHRRVFLAEMLAQNSDLFDHERVASYGDSMHQCQYIIEDLIDSAAENDAKTMTVCQIARRSKSLYLAANLLSHAIDRVGKTTITSNTNITAMKQTLENLLIERLVHKGENIYETEGRAGIRVLYVWSHDIGDKISTTDYLVNLIRNNPQIAELQCDVYDRPFRIDENLQFDLDAMTETCDTSKIYDVICEVFIYHSDQQGSTNLGELARANGMELPASVSRFVRSYEDYLAVKRNKLDPVDLPDSLGSELRGGGEEAAAEEGAEAVEDDDDGERQQQGRGERVVLQRAHVAGEIEADAARADEAKD